MVKLTLSPNIMRGIELGNSAFSMFRLKLSRNIRFMIDLNSSTFSGLK